MSRSQLKTRTGSARKKRVVRRERQEIITSVKLTHITYKQLQTIAKAMDRSQSWILREALEFWLAYHIKALEKTAGKDAVMIESGESQV